MQQSQYFAKSHIFLRRQLQCECVATKFIFQTTNTPDWVSEIKTKTETRHKHKCVDAPFSPRLNWVFFVSKLHIYRAISYMKKSLSRHTTTIVTWLLLLCAVRCFFFILLSCFVCVSFFFRYSYAFLCHFSLFTRFVLFIEPYVTEPISTATHRTRATYVTIHLTAIYHRYTYWYWWLWLIRTLIHVQRFQSTAAVCFFSLLHRCDYWETFISIEH